MNYRHIHHHHNLYIAWHYTGIRLLEVRFGHTKCRNNLGRDYHRMNHHLNQMPASSYR